VQLLSRAIAQVRHFTADAFFRLADAVELSPAAFPE
jgi:hypothetical protein